MMIRRTKNMNARRISFIIWKRNEDTYKYCVSCLMQLHPIEGYSVDIVTIELNEAKTRAKAYNMGRELTDAKYKIYLDESVWLVQTNALSEMLEVLKEPSIRMLGVLGANTIPINGYWWESMFCYGKYYALEDGDTKMMELRNPENKYQEVQVLDSYFFVTKNDCCWSEEFIGDCFFVTAQCAELRRNGDKIIVMKQNQPWCVYSRGFAVDKYFNEDWQMYRERYADYLKLPHEDDANMKSLLYSYGNGVRIHQDYRFFMPEGISIGEDAQIQRNAWFMLPYGNYEGVPRIIIGRRCDIGYRCTISAVNRIVLEDDVLIAANVHITDHNHAYESVGIPIKDQGPSSWTNEVVVGKGSWLANNVVIAGNVHIGCGVVVGAGSVVTGDLPDYTVAAGTPARVVKAYDWAEKAWIKIRDQNDYVQLINRRHSYGKA